MLEGRDLWRDPPVEHDVLRVNGSRYAIMPIGFEKLADDFVVPHDDGVWAFTR